MNEAWDRAKRIVADALEVDPSVRREVVLAACGNDGEILELVERLLRANDNAQGFMVVETPSPRTSSVLDSPDGEAAFDGAGTTIGPYRLLSILGRGGMGEVWRAQQTQPVERHVALKIIKLGMDTTQVVARFNAERQALAVMDHPNIAKVFDAGVTPLGRPYFAMELIDGVPMTRYADDHRLSIRERIGLLIEACNAIEHAHQKGVIHRDVKPSNLLVTVQCTQPMVKVIDFGIAKATAAQPSEGQTLTQEGQVLGTPEYASPEQASPGLDIDTRSDIYSLGVVLYELLTGAGPYDVANSGHVLFSPALLDVEPTRPSARLTKSETQVTVAASRSSTVRELRHELSGELDWIVLRAIDKNRDRRYATATELAQDLTRYLNKRPIRARPPSALYRFRKFTQRNRPSVFAAAALLVALVVGLSTGWSAFLRARADTRVATSRELAAASINLVSDDPQLSLLLAIASAEAAPTAEAEAALHRAVASRMVRTITGSSGIVVARDGTIMAWTPARLPTPRLVPTGARAVTLPKDGPFYVSGQEVRTLRGSGGQIYDVILRPDDLLSSIARDIPQDRRRDATSREWVRRVFSFSSYDPGTIMLWDPLTGRPFMTVPAIALGSEILALRRRDGDLRDMMISSDARRLVTTSSDGTVTLWDSGDGKELLTIPPAAVRGTGNPVFSPNGRLLAAGGRLWYASTGAPVMDLPESSNGVVFSPDGAVLVTADDDGTAGLWDIGTGRKVSSFLAHDAPVSRVAFSSRGDRLVTSADDGTIKLWDMTFAGPVSSGSSLFDLRDPLRVPPLPRVAVRADGRAVAVTSEDGTIVWDVDTRSTILRIFGDTSQVVLDGDAAFSADGALLATTRDGLRLWNVASGSVVLELRDAPSNASDVEFSPDGALLATGAPNGGAQVWDVRTGGLRRTLGGCPSLPCPGTSAPAISAIAFSPDGTRLATADGSTARIWDIETGTQVFALEGRRRSYLDVAFSADGKRLATAGDEAGVWELTSRTQLFRLDRPVSRVLFSPGGSRLVTVGTNGAARIWDALTGLPVLLLAEAGQEGDEITDVAFSPDGSWMAVASADLTVRTFPHGIEALLAAALERRSREFSPNECRQFLHVDHCPAREAPEPATGPLLSGVVVP